MSDRDRISDAKIDETVRKYGRRTADALISFIERASKEGATAEEVQALPAVARELFRLLFED